MSAPPPDHTVLLKTWFKPRILERAFSLIKEGQLRHLFFFRQRALLICEDDISAQVHISPGAGHLPFVFREGRCSQCIAGKEGQRCHHVAALALLCLRRNAEQLQAVTMAFPDSMWDKIGSYLHEQCGSGQTTILEEPDNEHLALTIRHSSGLKIRLHCHPFAAREIQNLGLTDESTPPGPKGTLLQPLIASLCEETYTEAEKALLARGSSTTKLHREQSPWLWLARMLFLQLPFAQPALRRQGNGSMTIRIPEQAPLFQLELAPHQGWELLRQFDLERLGFFLLPPARQFSRVQFTDDGSAISVQPWCQLNDGRRYSLKELEEQRFGSRYLLEQENTNAFFPLEPIPPQEQIREEETKTPSLFSFMGRMQQKGEGFIVPTNAIPDFLKRNREALRAPRHQVADDILELDIVREPEILELTDFQEDPDWCYLAGYYSLGNQQIDFSDIIEATSAHKDFIPGRQWLALNDSPLHWFHNLGQDRLTDNGRVKLTRSEMLLLGAQAPDLKITPSKKSENYGKGKKGTLSFLLGEDTGESSEKINSTHLRDYQIHGVHWLSRLHRHGMGGILADDMGLGKTHQALALIDQVTEEEDTVLLVCPAAVLYHWPDKQRQFFPHLDMTVYHGPQRDFAEAVKSRIIVTTFGILRQDMVKLAQVHFSMVIYDEMHQLKNKKTSTYQAAAQLTTATTFGLTGTPIENNILELETLLSLCVPDIFRSSHTSQLFKNADSSEARHSIQRITSPFILRRIRTQVLHELPDCSEDIRLCELSDDQVAAYRQVIDSATDLVDELLGEEKLTRYTHVLTTIVQLKQICNHLCQLQSCTDWRRYKSGKWDEFVRLLHQSLATNLKVVVFSQFTGMLDIIEAWLHSSKIDYVSLRGKVGARERNKRIQRFNTNKKCRVCCASLLAGGTGIDLTGAQVVIHFDRWWNPAKEEQATARVHRMGQKHPVQVYKLITAGTLEEKIHKLIEKKKNLAAEIIREDDASMMKTLNRKELAELLRYG